MTKKTIPITNRLQELMDWHDRIKLDIVADDFEEVLHRWRHAVYDHLKDKPKDQKIIENHLKNKS